MKRWDIPYVLALIGLVCVIIVYFILTGIITYVVAAYWTAIVVMFLISGGVYSIMDILTMPFNEILILAESAMFWFVLFYILMLLGIIRLFPFGRESKN